jgi:hypothetical protein
VLPTFLAESKEYLGGYFVRVYEPKYEQQWSDTVQGHARCAVNAFSSWHGGPVSLKGITEQKLSQFLKSEVSRGIQEHFAALKANRIRHIVNHWSHGRLRASREKAAPPGRRGTVQHFIANVLLPKMRKKKSRSVVSRLMVTAWRIHDFNGGKDLTFAKFTPDFCEDLLRDAVKCGVPDRQVDFKLRFQLVAISKAAVKAGLMTRRLHLGPVTELRRHWNGRPAASTPAMVSIPVGARPANRRADDWRLAERKKTCERVLAIQLEHSVSRKVAYDYYRTENRDAPERTRKALDNLFARYRASK